MWRGRWSTVTSGFSSTMSAARWPPAAMSVRRRTTGRRLVRRGRELTPEMILNGVRKEYAFLNDFTPEEAILAADPYRRQQQVYQQLMDQLRDI